MAFPSYSTGLISIAADSPTVVGDDTIWTAVNVRPGDLLLVDGAQITLITDVVDDTHLTIPAWKGGAKVSVPYIIFHSSPKRYDGGDAMLDVSFMIASLSKKSIIHSVPGDAPDPSLGNEDQYALKTNAGVWKLWLKTGGVWVLQGTPVGTTTRGNWSAVTNYVINDEVFDVNANAKQATWRSRTANLNKRPKDNPGDWYLAADAGDPGPTGPEGKTVRYGTGAPSNALGVDDDFYIATDTSMIYGPKAAGAWPAGKSLVGAPGGGGPPGNTGAPGADGKTVRYGVGAPSNALGNDGDFYISSGANMLYGPKAAGTWPAGASLVGTQGLQGPQGQGIEPDATGTLAERATFDNQPKGFAYLRTDVSPFQLFVKASNTTADWAGPTFIGGSATIGDLGHATETLTSTFDLGHAA
jgi:hypothetical protein